MLGKTKYFLSICGIAVIGAIVVVYKKKQHVVQETTKEHIAKVEVAKVTVMPMKRKLRMNGTIEAYKSVIVMAPVEGPIEHIYKGVGSKVKVNEPILRIDSSLAEANFYAAQASKLKEEADCVRAQAMFKDKIIAKSTLDKNEAEKKVADAKEKTAKIEMDRHIVRSPINGTIGLYNVKQLVLGAFVAKGNKLLQIDDMDHNFKVEFRVPELEAHNVRIGQDVTIKVPHLDLTCEAAVVQIDNSSDTSSHSLQVVAQLKTQQPDVKPGQFVKVILDIGDKENRIFVPESAIVNGEEGAKIYTVTTDNIAKQKRVGLGGRHNDMVEVEYGLDDTDIVVTAGQLNVHNNTEVQIVNDPNQDSATDSTTDDKTTETSTEEHAAEVDADNVDNSNVDKIDKQTSESESEVDTANNTDTTDDSKDDSKDTTDDSKDDSKDTTDDSKSSSDEQE